MNVPDSLDIEQPEALTAYLRASGRIEADEQPRIEVLHGGVSNRTVLVDQRLTGLLLGQTLHTNPAEIFRALVEATAFGALTIINRFEEYGIKIKQVVNCGGISEKNAMLMQIYADITGREMKISRSAQTCALGAAICGAVVAGKKAGGYSSFAQAQKAMAGIKAKTFKPMHENAAVYKKLYALYKQLHDSFGLPQHTADLSQLMKDLLAIKEAANANPEVL